MPDSKVLLVSAFAAILIFGGKTVGTAAVHGVKKTAHATAKVVKVAAKPVVWSAKRVTK